MGQMQKAPAPKQPSMKAKIAHMEKSQLGDDIGRIPNTLILPALDDYPRDLRMIAKIFWRKFSDTVVGMATSVSLPILHPGFQRLELTWMLG